MMSIELDIDPTTDSSAAVPELSLVANPILRNYLSEQIKSSKTAADIAATRSLIMELARRDYPVH